jgi:hypothetical protein
VVNYKQLRRNKRRFLALTGLTDKEFKVLLPSFQEAYEHAQPMNQTQSGRKRKRQVGGGRKAMLATMEDKLLFSLMYQKSYPVQELLAVTFGMSQAGVNHWVHRLLPILKTALEDLGMMPERDGSAFAQHEQAQGEALDLIIDGTERRRQRPKNPEKQALHYSGKKKIHADKNLVIVNAKQQRIGYLSPTYGGQIHDKKLADNEAIVYPAKTRLHKDTGFQGYEPKVKQTLQPKKTSHH